MSFKEHVLTLKQCFNNSGYGFFGYIYPIEFIINENRFTIERLYMCFRRQAVQSFVLTKVMEELAGRDIEHYDYIFTNSGCFKFQACILNI